MTSIIKEENNMNTVLVREKSVLASLKKSLANKFIILIEGDHSEENKVYTSDAPSEIRGVLSIDDTLSSMGFNYKRVASTDKKIKDYFNVADFVFIYAQGEYGEDGRIQGWLDYIGVDYPGPGIAASALCCDKLYFKYVINGAGVRTPPFNKIVATDNRETIAEKVRTLDFPVMLKDRMGGSSLGITLLSDKKSLDDWLSTESSRPYSKYFIEKYIKGTFVTVGIILLSTGYYILPVLTAETETDFYDAAMKLGKSDSEVKFRLGGFSSKLITIIKETAWTAFTHSGCEGIARVDMILKDNKAWVLEINTIPGISREGNFTQMFTSLGFTYEELILAIMNTAYLKKSLTLTGENAHGPFFDC